MAKGKRLNTIYIAAEKQSLWDDSIVLANVIGVSQTDLLFSLLSQVVDKNRGIIDNYKNLRVQAQKADINVATASIS